MRPIGGNQMRERFIGREQELDTLENLYRKAGFQMAVIYGRRRIGKSTLIKEFIKDKKSVFYTATLNSLSRNLELWGKEVLAALAPEAGKLKFAQLDDLLDFIGIHCREERTVVVIDELPYLASVSKSLLSVIQSHIDNQWIDSQIFFIICGSSISFMEEKVLSQKSPLFGRRTCQIRLEPFNYLEAAEFVPSYSYEDKALVYGVTGGIAKYLSLFDEDISVDENIKQLFFSKSGYLYEEPYNLLTQEYKNVPTYNDIINAIATGAGKLVDIADRAHMEPTVVSHALNKLIATGIIRKEYAITDEKNNKKIRYRFKDQMFKFWYRYIPEGTAAIELGRGSNYYEHSVKPRLPEYMGDVFEDMCRFFTLNIGTEGRLGTFISSVGKWWGTDPVKKEQTDIDVVGLNTFQKEAVLGECKYKNEILDKKVMMNLIEKKGLLPNEYRIVQFLLFSKSGFSDWVVENAEEYGVRLVGLPGMY